MIRESSRVTRLYKGAADARELRERNKAKFSWREQSNKLRQQVSIIEREKKRMVSSLNEAVGLEERARADMSSFQSEQQSIFRSLQNLRKSVSDFQKFIFEMGSDEPSLEKLSVVMGTTEESIRSFKEKSRERYDELVQVLCAQALYLL